MNEWLLCFWKFTYLFIQQIICTSYAPGTVLGNGDKPCARQTKFLPSWHLYSDRNRKLSEQVRYLLCKKAINYEKIRHRKCIGRTGCSAAVLDGVAKRVNASKILTMAKIFSLAIKHSKLYPYMCSKLSQIYSIHIIGYILYLVLMKCDFSRPFQNEFLKITKHDRK